MKTLKIGILAVAAILLFTGCGEEKKSSKGRSNNGWVVPGGVGGPGGSNVLHSGLGNTSSYGGAKAQAAWDFYIGQNGGVVAQGELYSFQISTNQYSGCSIPLGTYNVTTEVPGTIDNYSGAVSGVRLIANGPAQVRMTILDARFFQATPFRSACNGELFSQDMYAYVSIDSINGYVCNYSAYSFGYNSQFFCGQ